MNWKIAKQSTIMFCNFLRTDLCHVIVNVIRLMYLLRLNIVKPAISVKSPQQNIFLTVLTAVFYLSSCSHVMMMVTFDTTWSLIKLIADTHSMTR